MSINFTPKTSHSCLKNGTLGFPGSEYLPRFPFKRGFFSPTGPSTVGPLTSTAKNDMEDLTFLTNDVNLVVCLKSNFEDFPQL